MFDSTLGAMEIGTVTFTYSLSLLLNICLFSETLWSISSLFLELMYYQMIIWNYSKIHSNLSTNAKLTKNKSIQILKMFHLKLLFEFTWIVQNLYWKLKNQKCTFFYSVRWFNFPLDQCGNQLIRIWMSSYRFNWIYSLVAVPKFFIFWSKILMHLHWR